MQQPLEVVHPMETDESRQAAGSSSLPSPACVPYWLVCLRGGGVCAAGTWRATLEGAEESAKEWALLPLIAIWLWKIIVNIQFCQSPDQILVPVYTLFSGQQLHWSCIAQKHPLIKVLRLVCLQSVCNSGLKQKVLDYYKEKFYRSVYF